MASNETHTSIPNAQASNPKSTNSLASDSTYQNEDLFTFHNNDSIDFYDTTLGYPIENLDIELGSDQIPRIQCSAHKLNLAVRGAFVRHKTICKHLSSLNRFIAKIHKSYNLSRIYQHLHCRLRSDNNTRWGSGFMSFDSAKRAYLAGAFTKSECPVQIEIIDSYLEVLSPAYIVNLEMQYKKASISQIIYEIRRVRICPNYFQYFLHLASYLI